MQTKRHIREKVVDALTYKPPLRISSPLDIGKDFRKHEKAFAKAIKKYEG